MKRVLPAVWISFRTDGGTSWTGPTSIEQSGRCVAVECLRDDDCPLHVRVVLTVVLIGRCLGAGEADGLSFVPMLSRADGSAHRKLG